MQFPRVGVDERHLHGAVAEESGDGLEPHAAELGGEGVTQLVRVDADAAAAAHVPHDPVTVERAAVIGDQAAVRADVGQVSGGPGCCELDEVGVEGHVAVVAELSVRDPQPVSRSDADDCVGLEVSEPACAHPFSRGHPLWRKPVLRVCAAQRLME